MHFSDWDILVILGCLSLLCLLAAIAYWSITSDWMDKKLLQSACDNKVVSLSERQAA